MQIKDDYGLCRPLYFRSLGTLSKIAEILASEAKEGELFVIDDINVDNYIRKIFVENFIKKLTNGIHTEIDETKTVSKFQTSEKIIYYFNLFNLRTQEDLKNSGFFEQENNSITILAEPYIAEKHITKKRRMRIIIKQLDDEYYRLTYCISAYRFLLFPKLLRYNFLSPRFYLKSFKI